MVTAGWVGFSTTFGAPKQPNDGIVLTIETWSLHAFRACSATACHSRFRWIVPKPNVFKASVFAVVSTIASTCETINSFTSR